MSDPGIKVYVHRNPVTATLDIYLSDEVGPFRRVATPVTLTFAPVEDGAEAAPTFRLRWPVGEAFLTAIAEAAAASGHKPIDQSKVEGRLEATERHLEDLRALLGLAVGSGPGLAHLEVVR